MNEFKQLIVKLRGEKGWTQLQLANELGVAKSTIASWETGARSPVRAMYEQIADLFNVDIDYLYGRTNIRQKIHFDNDGTPYTAPSLNTDIRRIERARKKMPPKEQQKMMKILEASFENYFEDDYEDGDND
jgi:Predicted transcriptional regulators